MDEHCGPFETGRVRAAGQSGNRSVVEIAAGGGTAQHHFEESTIPRAICRQELPDAARRVPGILSSSRANTSATIDPDEYGRLAYADGDGQRWQPSAGSRRGTHTRNVRALFHGRDPRQGDWAVAHRGICAGTLRWNTWLGIVPIAGESAL